MTEKKPLSEIEKELHEILNPGTETIYGGCGMSCGERCKRVVPKEISLNDVLLALFNKYHVANFVELVEKLQPDEWVDGYSSDRDKKREKKKRNVLDLLRSEEFIYKFDNWGEEMKRKLWELLSKK